MELQIDAAVNTRQYAQLQRLLKTRSKNYQTGISAQRAAYTDRQLSALMLACACNTTDDNTDVDFDPASPQAVFIALGRSVVAANCTELEQVIAQLTEKWDTLDASIHEALADAIIFYQNELTRLLQPQENGISQLFCAERKAWFQYLSVFLAPYARQHLIPPQADFLTALTQASRALTLEQAQNFIQENTDFFNLDSVNEAWVLVFCNPNEESLQQHLLQMEETDSEVAFSVYGVWGLPWCLERIAQGMEPVRTNAAAYRQWLFLTDQALPETPILQDAAIVTNSTAAASSSAGNVPNIADSSAAKDRLQSLMQCKLSDAHYFTAQKIRLTKALLSEHCIKHEIYALGLMCGPYATPYVSTRHGYRHHLKNLSQTAQISHTSWWEL